MDNQSQDEHEIRVKAHQPAKNYINRAATLLLRDQVVLKEGESKQAPLNFVTFKASGNAIHTALIASDIIRRKVSGLHQINRIANLVVKQQKRNSDEEFEKNLAIFEITLTRNPSEADKKDIGYIGLLQNNTNEVFKLSDIVQNRENRLPNENRQQGGDRRRNVRRYNNNDENNNNNNYNNGNRNYRGNRNNNRNYRKGSDENQTRQYRGQRENQGNNRRRYDDDRQGGNERRYNNNNNNGGNRRNNNNNNGGNRRNNNNNNNNNNN